MKRKRYTEPQIVLALQQAESGTAVAEPTFCRWRKRYAGLGVSEIRRLRQLEGKTGASSSSWLT